MFPMIAGVNTPEVIQLTVGAILGSAVSINLSKFGMSLMDPETRWKAAGIIGTFLFTFVVLSDLLIN